MREVWPDRRLHHERWDGGGYPTGSPARRSPSKRESLPAANLERNALPDRLLPAALAMRSHWPSSWKLWEPSSTACGAGPRSGVAPKRTLRGAGRLRCFTSRSARRTRFRSAFSCGPRLAVLRRRVIGRHRYIDVTYREWRLEGAGPRPRSPTASRRPYRSLRIHRQRAEVGLTGVVGGPDAHVVSG